MSLSESSMRSRQTSTTKPRLEIDITDISRGELREFVRHRGAPVHFERRGGRTYLITTSD